MKELRSRAIGCRRDAAMSSVVEGGATKAAPIEEEGGAPEAAPKGLAEAGVPSEDGEKMEGSRANAVWGRKIAYESRWNHQTDEVARQR